MDAPAVSDFLRCGRPCDLVAEEDKGPLVKVCGGEKGPVLYELAACPKINIIIIGVKFCLEHIFDIHERISRGIRLNSFYSIVITYNSQ